MPTGRPTLEERPSELWLSIERKYDAKMRDVLLTLFEQHADSDRVRGELGIGRDTLRVWLRMSRLRLVNKVKAIPMPEATVELRATEGDSQD